MQLTLWGTRGSSPRTMGHTDFVTYVRQLTQSAEKRGITTLQGFRDALCDGTFPKPLATGGHTPCSEVEHNGQHFFVDCGTGLRVAGTHAMAAQRKEFTFFLTHLHWDHLMGLPFFVPIFIPGTKITMYHVHPQAPDNIRNLFNGINFPVKWDELGAEIEFKKIKVYDSLKFDDIEVNTFALDHPGGSFGYRFDAKGKSLAIGVDGEYKRLTRRDLGKDLPYYQKLDLLVFDAQYELSELVNKYDWGHCSPEIGIDLALREEIKNLVFIHHDPWATEDKLQQAFENAAAYKMHQLPDYADTWSGNEQSGPNLFMGYDGFQFNFD